METPNTVAARLAEAQADLAVVLGAEQRALELAGNYRALSAEQETRQAEVQYLNASIQQARMARGYAKQADELHLLVKTLTLQLEDAHHQALDNLAFLGRLMLTQEQMAGMDDMGGIAA